MTWYLELVHPEPNGCGRFVTVPTLPHFSVPYCMMRMMTLHVQCCYFKWLQSPLTIRLLMLYTKSYALLSFPYCLLLQGLWGLVWLTYICWVDFCMINMLMKQHFVVNHTVLDWDFCITGQLGYKHLQSKCCVHKNYFSLYLHKKYV